MKITVIILFALAAAMCAGCADVPVSPAPTAAAPGGFCCVAGVVSPADEGRCAGFFSRSEFAARERCTIDQPGFCCVGQRVAAGTRGTCSGAFFVVEATATQFCPQIQPPSGPAGPKSAGYCCTDGKVFASPSGGCPGGSFSTQAEEAVRSCSVVVPRQ